MAYKKPQIVAKSAPQRSFVAGCPEQKKSYGIFCNKSCQQAN